MKKLKYGNPILFRTPYWLSLPEELDEDAKFKLKPLSYKTIREIEYNNYSQLSPHNEDELLINSIVDTYGIHGFNDNATLVKQLPKNIKDYLINDLIQMSTVTNEQYRNLEDMISVLLDPKLQDENWDCDTCIHKKLQAHRACGFIDEAERLPFRIKINNSTYTTCPISTLDRFILNSAGEAYKLIENGILPENGSVGDQSLWAIQAASIYKGLINKLEKEMLDSHKK